MVAKVVAQFRRDEGLSLPWLPQLARQVQRLKLVKRSMYERANVDLLRLRVLHAT